MRPAVSSEKKLEMRRRALYCQPRRRRVPTLMSLPMQRSAAARQRVHRGRGAARRPAPPCRRLSRHTHSPHPTSPLAALLRACPCACVPLPCPALSPQQPAAAGVHRVRAVVQAQVCAHGERAGAVLRSYVPVGRLSAVAWCTRAASRQLTMLPQKRPGSACRRCEGPPLILRSPVLPRPAPSCPGHLACRRTW